MEAKCDHNYVGMIAFDDYSRILLVNRPPFGLAPPSGHLDGDSYGIACCKIFQEQSGLRVRYATAPEALFIPPKYICQNWKCSREGEYHFWHLYKVRWEGMLSRTSNWYSREQVKIFLRVTQRLLEAQKAEEPSWRTAIKEATLKIWGNDSHIDSAWYNLFQHVPELARFLEGKTA